MYVSHGLLLSVFFILAHSRIAVAFPFQPRNCTDGSPNAQALQEAINKFVDSQLIDVLEMIRERQPYPSVPEIHETFTTGSGIFQTTGYFDAVDGTFRNVLAIRRWNDADICQDGSSFRVFCKFGISPANVFWPQYHLKYGIIRTSGTLGASVTEMALKIVLVIDYSSEPCTVSMDHAKVSDFGGMNFQLTGLGIFNGLVSRIIGNEIMHDRSGIIDEVETELSASIESHLSSLNCEKY